MSAPTVVRGAVAGAMEDLDLDRAFAEAEARSRAGQDCAVWWRRSLAMRTTAYRVVACRQGEALGQAWEQIALFFAVGSDVRPKVLSGLTSPKNGDLGPRRLQRLGRPQSALGSGQCIARESRMKRER